MAHVGTCEVCGLSVTDSHAAHPVSGWEAKRAGGGANRIIGRVRDDSRVAHRRCIEGKAAARRRGISDDQEGFGI